MTLNPIDHVLRFLKDADKENKVLRETIRLQEASLCMLEARVEQLTQTLKDLIK